MAFAVKGIRHAPAPERGNEEECPEEPEYVGVPEETVLAVDGKGAPEKSQEEHPEGASHGSAQGTPPAEHHFSEPNV